ncbi:MAG: helix-turn-helix transcriptional regulator [Planctomycetota bacterium]
MSLANYTDRVQGGFGRALRQMRQELGLTQEQLGLRAGVDRVYISELERGLKCPTLNTVSKIAYVLDALPSQLIRRTEALLDLSSRGLCWDDDPP